MRKICGIALILVMLIGLAACGKTNSSEQRKTDTSSNITKDNTADKNENDKDQNSGETSILVAYFSCTGTTKPLAEYAAEYLNADLYEIESEKPYTSKDLNYNNSDSRATKEQNDSGARPAISGNVEKMSQYDTVVLAYPIWLAYHNLIQCTQA